MVTWFAGLFYIVRLFVNHTEALNKPEPERSILINQFKKMEKPLWVGITYPSMIMTVICGSLMLYLNPGLLYQPYMHLKLTFVGCLLIYHFYCGILFKKFQNHEVGMGSFGLRILNEIASVFLVAIVFIIELANSLSFRNFFITIGFFCLLLLFVIVKLWKKRKSNQ